MQPDPSPPRRGNARLLTGAIVGLLAVAAIVTGLWLMFFAGSAPAAPSIDQAAGALDPSVGSTTGPAPTASASGSAAPATAATGLDGAWTVDTSIGTFSDYSNAWAGFRVDEVLSGIGDATAIGRTPAVSGQITVSGTRLTAGRIEADLTQITSDRPRRDPAIQRALETSQFPTATFELSEPVDFGRVLVDGETVSVTVPGRLTIHGVTQDVRVPLEAKVVGDTIAVVGSIPITFADYGVTMPTAPIVLSVQDHGTLELQLFFSRS